jgi:nucleoside-diphosphate-sugar epimerase
MIRHLQQRPVPPRRVVVLGASGFVVDDLIYHLEALGVETVALPSASFDLREPEMAGPLRELLRPNDSLVFTAALTPDRGRDVKTFTANIAMAATVGAALEVTPVAHVVYLSSDAVYPDDATFVRESTTCDPRTLHGLMHLARERMLAHSLERIGTPYLVLRPSLLFGVRDTHNGYGPNRFVRSALADERITLVGDGEERRDHVFIKDVSRLIGQALARRSVGVLNVATGTSVSYARVAELVAERVPGAVVTSTPRPYPVSHRHYDVTERVKAFPDFALTPLHRAIDEVLNKVALPVRALR